MKDIDWRGVHHLVYKVPIFYNLFPMTYEKSPPPVNLQTCKNAKREKRIGLIDSHLHQVHAKHEETAAGKSVYREYNREFLLPQGTNPELIKSSLSKVRRLIKAGHLIKSSPIEWH